MSNTVSAIRDFISSSMGRNLDGVADDASLLEAGILDSLGVLSLITFVDEAFGIEVAEDDMMPENFDSISALAGFIEQRQRGVRRS